MYEEPEDVKYVQFQPAPAGMKVIYGHRSEGGAIGITTTPVDYVALDSLGDFVPITMDEEGFLGRPICPLGYSTEPESAIAADAYWEKKAAEQFAARQANYEKHRAETEEKNRVRQ